jgi:molybdopterin-synthase adenylyltransferase
MFRPRIKPEHTPYRVRDGRVRIGGTVYGIAAEVRDPTGSVWTLLEALDGSRSVDEVVAEVARRHPDESTADVRAAIDQFAAAGYVEDAGAPDPEELTARERERYGRARAYYRWMDLTPRGSTWEPQLALRRSRVTVLGLGGTGCTAALALAASGVGRLHCLDFDNVELSNLSRQVLYVEDDVGLSKVDAAVARLRRLNSDIEVTGERREINGIPDVALLASQCDVLLLAADSPREIDSWTNHACLATGTPWVVSGYHGALVSVGTYRPGEGACYQCVQDVEDQRRLAAGAGLIGDAQRPASRSNAVGAASAALSGNLAAHCVISLLTGVPPAPVGKVYSMNLFDLEASCLIEHPRLPDCPDCGDPGKARRGDAAATDSSLEAGDPAPALA